MTVSIIVAVAENGAIGNQNSLLWHIKEDMQLFRRVTSGHAVVMGRKTFESLGRPLPKRTNIVITRQPLAIEGCTVVHSLEEALAACPEGEEECFIIGGAQIYEQALPLADRLYLTVVEHPYEGDTHFPAWDRAAWRLVACERLERGEEYPHPFRFEVYERA